MYINCFEDILEERKVLLRKIRDNIQETYQGSVVYVFGSYAKGLVHANSDIGILVMHEEELDPKEARKIRYKIEDNLIEEFGWEPEIQIVLYNSNRFKLHSAEFGLAGNVSTYMMRIEG